MYKMNLKVLVKQPKRSEGSMEQEHDQDGFQNNGAGVNHVGTDEYKWEVCLRISIR